MAWESVERLITPTSIAFNQAISVAVLGLVVNGASVFILGMGHEHGHEHHHDHRLDHNLRSAYFHVLADAITSLLAIFALLLGKYFGAVWMDSLMGIVGAALVARWSLGLLKSTGVILLDQQSSKETQDSIRKTIENDDNRIVDLHLWAVGPDIYSVIISIVSRSPQQPDYYKSLLANHLTLEHISVEVHEYEEA
jgi:cation diffusion facilitator family transporter